jgi:hypothetical protein
MSEFIKIVHQKSPAGFGKPQTLTYDGVIFSNGKVAYVDENDIILSCEKKETLVKELEKSGKVRVETQGASDGHTEQGR